MKTLKSLFRLRHDRVSLRTPRDRLARSMPGEVGAMAANRLGFLV